MLGFRRKPDLWFDPYRGWIDDRLRCASTEPGFAGTRCMKDLGHAGDHRYTSGADGRSVEWK